MKPSSSQVVAHDLDHPVPQEQRPLHLRPAEIEVAMLQPQVFARQVLLAGLKRRREALVEHRQPLGAKLDLAGAQLRVDRSLGPRRDLAASPR